jgi:predicted regulator of Ras-like GTPase activity (Roadblock/LC7/MglB family)
VDAAEALKDLTEISSQIEAAVLLSADGEVLAATIEDGARAERLVAAVTALVGAASVDGGQQLVQLEAATDIGSVFVARDDERVVAAVTKAEPTAGLVFFDLKTCLRAAAAAEGDDKPRPRARRRSKTAAESSE